MTKENTKYIRTRIQENTMDNLGKSLELLNDVYTDELYYNAELATACHEMQLKLIAMIHECHEEQNRFKSILDE
tara:strand:+ start:80 stop:301 length:222 start_codon:yes stop_codon:yes gene_type:complete